MAESLAAVSGALHLREVKSPCRLLSNSVQRTRHADGSIMQTHSGDV